MHWQKPNARTVVLIVMAILTAIVVRAYLPLYNLTGMSAAPSVLLGDKLIVKMELHG